MFRRYFAFEYRKLHAHAVILMKFRYLAQLCRAFRFFGRNIMRDGCRDDSRSAWLIKSAVYSTKFPQR